MNYEYQKEYNFVALFSNKHLKKLNENSQNNLKELFENIINNNDQIKCGKNKMFKKLGYL